MRDLYCRTVTIDEAESKQEEFNIALQDLKEYNPKHDKYVTLKNNLIDNASKFYKGREKIIDGFKNKVFPLYYDSRYHEERMKYEEEEKKQDKKPFTPEEVIEWMINREKLHINNELFKKHFKLQKPVLTYKVSYKTNNDKEKNSKLLKVFNSGLEYLEKEI